MAKKYFTFSIIGALCLALLFSGCLLPPAAPPAPTTPPTTPPGQPPVVNPPFQPPTLPVPAFNNSFSYPNASFANCDLGVSAPGQFADSQGRLYNETVDERKTGSVVQFSPGIWHDARNATVNLFGGEWKISRVKLADCNPENARVLAIGESYSLAGYDISLLGVRSPACANGCADRAEVKVSRNNQSEARVLVPDTGFRFVEPTGPRIAVQVKQVNTSSSPQDARVLLLSCVDDGGWVELFNTNTNEFIHLAENGEYCGYQVHYNWTILDKRYHDMDALAGITFTKTSAPNNNRTIAEPSPNNNRTIPEQKPVPGNAGNTTAIQNGSITPSINDSLTASLDGGSCVWMEEGDFLVYNQDVRVDLVQIGYNAASDIQPYAAVVKISVLGGPQIIRPTLVLSRPTIGFMNGALAYDLTLCGINPSKDGKKQASFKIASIPA